MALVVVVALPEQLERAFAVPGAGLDAGERVADRRVILLLQRLLEDPARGLPIALAVGRERREEVLPRRRLVDAGDAADREHRRPRLLRDRVPLLADVVEVDERPCRRVHLLAVDGERRM